MDTKKTPWFVLLSPELGKPFQEFYETCKTKGILDEKTKSLLMLVSASILQHVDNAEEYISAAFEAGATREEITEALLIAAAESAKAHISWGNNITLNSQQSSKYEVF